MGWNKIPYVLWTFLAPCISGGLARTENGPEIVHHGSAQNGSKTRQKHEVQRQFLLIFSDISSKNSDFPGPERVVLAKLSKWVKIVYFS